MTEDIETAVEEFLDSTETTLEEYDQGYADADATVAVLRDRISDLRDAVDDE